MFLYTHAVKVHTYYGIYSQPTAGCTMVQSGSDACMLCIIAASTLAHSTTMSLSFM